MDPEPLSRSTIPTASPKHQNMAQSPINDGNSTKSEEPSCHSSDAISSLISDTTNESMLHSVSPTQSPPIQVMERPEDFEFEHGRIPSSVFASRCSSSMEWSLVSNDSLFSIRITNSYTRDQAYLLAADVFKSGELMNSDDLMSSRASSSLVGGESDVNSLKVETPSKLDVPRSILDEPQKVVRWKSQVEHHVDEEVPSQGDQWESSPLTNHKSSEFGNQAPAESKKKSCWSSCNCGFCNLPNQSCWNGCWTPMSCLNSKSKRVCCSPHSIEASAPTSVAANETGVKLPKPASKKGCCFGPCVACSGSWSWSCH